MARALLTGPRTRLLAGLAGISMLCLGLLGVRIVYSGRETYSFLAWNLLLAAVPLAIALAIETVVRRGAVILVPFLAVLWFLFLPNAPYVVTDFVHLTRDPPVPLWFDAVLFTAFACTSLLLGLVSIHLLKRLSRRKLGAAPVWTLIVIVFIASSLAIYLGRFRQWNSWDLLVRPSSVLGDLTSAHLPRLGGVTVGFTIFLLAMYAIVESVMRRAEVQTSSTPSS